MSVVGWKKDNRQPEASTGNVYRIPLMPNHIVKNYKTPRDINNSLRKFGQFYTMTL